MQELTAVAETAVAETAVAETAVAEKTFGQSPLAANDGSPDVTKSKASTPRGVGLVTEYNVYKIGRITTGGTVTEFTIAAGSGPADVHFDTNGATIGNLLHKESARRGCADDAVRSTTSIATNH